MFITSVKATQFPYFGIATIEVILSTPDDLRNIQNLLGEEIAIKNLEEPVPVPVPEQTKEITNAIMELEMED